MPGFLTITDGVTTLDLDIAQFSMDEPYVVGGPAVRRAIDGSALTNARGEKRRFSCTVYTEEDAQVAALVAMTPPGEYRDVGGAALAPFGGGGTFVVSRGRTEYGNPGDDWSYRTALAAEEA